MLKPYWGVAICCFYHLKWVTEEEVRKVIDFWQEAEGGAQEAESPWDELLAQEAFLADRDDLIGKAVEIVKKTQQEPRILCLLP